MRRLLFVFGLLLVAACGSSVQYTNHSSDALGISFEYPQTWVIEAGALEVNVATDESLFAANTADFSSGAVANFSVLPTAAIGGDMVTALTQFADFIATGEEAEQVGEVETLVINGRDAAQTTVAFTEGATMVVTMLRGDEQVVLMAAVYGETQYAEILTHMVESVTFDE